MKLSKKELKQIIQEEIDKELLEGEPPQSTPAERAQLRQGSKRHQQKKRCIAECHAIKEEVDKELLEENLSDALGKIIAQLQKLRQIAGKAAPRAATAGSKQAQPANYDQDEQDEKVKDAKCRKLKPAQVYDWTIDACNDPDQAADNHIAELSG